MFSIFQPSDSRLKSLIGDSQDVIEGESGPGAISQFVHHLVDVKQCQMAGLNDGAQEKIATGLLIVTIALFLLALVTRNAALLFFIVLAPFSIKIWLSSKVAARADGFDKDFAALLLSMASSLRAGVDATSALERCAHLFPKESVMHQELEKFSRNLASGMTEDECMQAFGDDIDHPDLELFRRSFMLSRKQGGSLSQCLQRLARFTRQRQSFRRKIRGAIAMQKLSGFGIAGCALTIIVMQATSQPEMFMNAFQNPLGFRMLTIGACLILTGIFLLLRLATYRGNESA